jgi:hypothetical protein
MEGVAAGLGHRVDQTAGSAAVFGVEVAQPDLELLDVCLAVGVDGAGAAAGFGKESLVVVGAVHGVVVVEAGDAAVGD